MSKKSSGSKVPQVKCIYDKDSKRFHRYSIGEYGDEIVGNLYVAKNAKSVPKQIMLNLVSNEPEDEDEEE